MVYQQPDGTFDGPVDLVAETLNYLGVTLVAVAGMPTAVDYTQAAYFPDVSVAGAYNPLDDVYFVVWADDDDNDDTTDIYGQLIDGDGVISGGKFVISDATDSQYVPDVAYDPASGYFLVVWEDDRNGAQSDVYGQFVRPNGSLSEGNFAVADGAGWSREPAVAADPLNDRLLVAFTDDRNGTFEIFGQLITASGELFGTTATDNFLILSRASDFRDQYFPSLAYNPTAAEYLLAVDDGFTDTVMVRRVGADGTLYDHTNDANTTADVDDYEVVNLDGANTSVDYNPALDSYLVAWNDYIDGTQFEDVQAILLDASLTPGAVLDLGTAAALDDMEPTVAANPHGGDFLVAYYEYDFGTVATTVSLATAGTYSADPRLYWAAGNGTEGTATPSVATGATATFTIDYFSAGDLAPTVKELQIDFNNNGTFGDTETILAPRTVLPPPGGNGWLTGLILLALISMVSISLHTAGVRNAPRLAALALIVAVTVAGCAWWDGTYSISPGYSAPAEGLIETFTMTEVDSGDTVYSDGKSYTVDVVVGANPGSYWYKFVFENTNRRAYAVGALERKLTVTD